MLLCWVLTVTRGQVCSWVIVGTYDIYYIFYLEYMCYGMLNRECLGFWTRFLVRRTAVRFGAQQVAGDADRTQQRVRFRGKTGEPVTPTFW